MILTGTWTNSTDTFLFNGVTYTVTGQTAGHTDMFVIIQVQTCMLLKELTLLISQPVIHS